MKKEITYQNFKIEYETNGEVPCQYINIIDQMLVNANNFDIEILINHLNSCIDMELKNLDYLIKNTSNIINNINNLSNIKQAYNISKMLSKKFYEYVKAYSIYSQINSIKVVSNNNDKDYLEQLSKLINKIDEHKEAYSKLIEEGKELYKELFKGASNKFDSLSKEQKVNFIKTTNSIISSTIKVNKNNIINESMNILNEEDYNIITLAGDLISMIINGVRGVFGFLMSIPKLFNSFTEGLFYTGIGLTFVTVLLVIFTDIGKTGFMALLLTIIQTLLSLAPVRLMLTAVGIAFAIMFISMILFLTISICQRIKEVYDDNQNEKEINDLDLNDKLNKANEESKNKSNNKKNNNVSILFTTPSLSSSSTISTSSPSIDSTNVSVKSNINNNTLNTSNLKFNFNDSTSTKNNNNSTDNNIFGGFNNTSGFKPNIQSKPNDKYGIF